MRVGQEVAAVEVKPLSDLGPQQLAHYRAAFPSVEVYCVLHLGELPVNLRGATPWESPTWESVLEACSSTNGWVAITARAWLGQLASLVPVVDALSRGRVPARPRQSVNTTTAFAAGSTEPVIQGAVGFGVAPATPLTSTYENVRQTQATGPARCAEVQRDCRHPPRATLPNRPLLRRVGRSTRAQRRRAATPRFRCPARGPRPGIVTGRVNRDGCPRLHP